MYARLKKHISMTTCLFFIAINCAIAYQGSNRLNASEESGYQHKPAAYDVWWNAPDDENLKSHEIGNTKDFEQDEVEQYNSGENGAIASNLSRFGNTEVIGPVHDDDHHDDDDDHHHHHDDDDHDDDHHHHDHDDHTNSAPRFIEGSITTRTVAENTVSGVNIGSAVAARDADNHTLAYTLGGPDASSFTIDSNSGQLRTRAALDYETKSTYTVTITVSDGSLTATTTVTINVSDVVERSPNVKAENEGSNRSATPTVETSFIVIAGTITNIDGTPAEAGLSVTIAIGSNTQKTVSESGGIYSVVFFNPLGVVARTMDTVEVQVLRQATGEMAENTIQLSSEQISAVSATINLQFSNSEYLLSVPMGLSLIHVPLKVTSVDGVAMTIKSIGDLYDALGGVATVNLLVTHDSKTQQWDSYFGASSKGKSADKVLTDDLGIIVIMKAPASVRLQGSALGQNGSSSITLRRGINLVGVPLKDSRITWVQDLFSLKGIEANVSMIIVLDNSTFRMVEPSGDNGNIPITGGQAFIMNAQKATTIAIEGSGWTNIPEVARASAIAVNNILVEDATPVLAIAGSIVDDVRIQSGSGKDVLPIRTGFRVTIKNLSTDRAVSTVTEDEKRGYHITVVDMETRRAAQIGDILEISAQSPVPFVGVHPVRYTVTDEDVRRGWVSLAELVAYEIPTRTQLLLNYPNPFNPETWIPYHLGEDAFVTLTIYDLRGSIVRRLNIGHRIAAVYESQAKAIYWDGRNEFGEGVASGVYFYHLSAGNYSATRKMVISK